MASLTPQERRVLVQLVMGKKDAEVAEHLGLKVSTVKKLVGRIKRKLEARTRVEAAMIALLGSLPSEEIVERFMR